MQSFLQSQVGQALAQLLPLVVIFGLMYLVMIKPQQKRKKQEEELRKSIAIGDEITTIGGIMGKVVKIKDDEILIVTCMVGNPNERSTMRFAKWAVRDVVKKAESKAASLDEPEENEEASEEN